MELEKTDEINIIYNDDGECASPLGHIFYQHVSIDKKYDIIGTTLNLYIKIPKEHSKDLYSELHIETPCDDEKMLTALLNFPAVPLSVISKCLPRFKKAHSPSTSYECSFHIGSKEEGQKKLEKHIIKWCMKYGCPFEISQLKNEIMTISESQNHIRIKVDIMEFVFKIWKLKECAFLLNSCHKESFRDEYKQFSKNIYNAEKLTYSYYKSNYSDILKETAETIKFSSKFSYNNKESIFVKVINESPIDAAFYQLFLMYSFANKKRVCRCRHCGNYFVVEDARKKYCNKKGCNKSNHHASKKRQIRTQPQTINKKETD